MIVNYPLFMLRWFLALCVVCFTVLFFMIGQGILGFGFLAIGTGLVYALKDSRPQVKHNAHFATPAELSDMTKGQFDGDGVLVGLAYKQPLVVKPGLSQKKEIGHFMWVGPSRSGKGLSIASNLYNWTGSAIVVDIKGEIAAQTAGYRRDVLGQDVFIINPSSGETTHQFDPFAELETDEQILSAALTFMNPEASGANAIFPLRAATALAAIIRAAKIQNEPVTPFLDRMLYHPDGVRGMSLALQKLKDEQVTKWLNSFLGKDPNRMDWEEAAGDRFLNNSYQNLKTTASRLTTPGIKYMTGGSDFTAIDLVARPTTLYLVFRESELGLNIELFNLVIDAIFRSIMRTYDLHPGMKGQKILAIFDEAFRAKPNLLTEYAATVAGRDIYMCIYVQSIAQIAEGWGEAGQTAIMENVHTKVFLPAVDRSRNDVSGTGAFVAASCGVYMVESKGISKDEHAHELQSNVNLEERDLITASQFAMLPVGQSIILCNNLAPILAHRLEPWRFKAYEEAKNLKMPKPVMKKLRPAVVEESVESPENAATSEAAPPAPVAPAAAEIAKTMANANNEQTVRAVTQAAQAAPSTAMPEEEKEKVNEVGAPRPPALPQDPIPAPVVSTGRVDPKTLEQLMLTA
ncbi:type IV secretory system conjugative DNA transfer family protein [Deinococcus fonticola]|uniref:type IV secretory system conjugative DNA transfer family protein n=1 Tax=Deinococcus fonticola TaxID=2528713 RepID=UPI0010750312|nr:type IV secretory system conjugative DNA transfer family protein [Deinococcus fonticola]